MAKKWTKAEREAASIAGKKRWAARKLSATTAKYALNVPVTQGSLAKALSDAGYVAEPASYGGAVIRPIGAEPGAARKGLATEIVRLMAENVPADVIVKVVERILRP